MMGRFKGVKYVFNFNKLWECQQTGCSYVPGRIQYAVVTSGPCYFWTVYAPPGPMATDLYGLSFDKSVEQMQRDLVADFYSDNEVDNLLNLVEARQCLDGLQGSFEFLRKLCRGNPLKLVDFSNQFLSYSFGYAPLVSDIRKTVRGMSSIRTQLRQLHGRKTQQITRVKSTFGEISYPGIIDPSDPAWTSGYARRIFPTSQAVRRVGLHGISRVKYESTLFRELDYILSRYIASGPVNLAWEKVPFSFVFDWFVDTSDIIGRLDNTLMGGRKEIQDMWTSVKASCITPVYFKNNTSVLMFDEFQGAQVGLSEFRYYHREPLVLPGPSTGSSGRFGKKQSLLSLALFNQMVANLRKR
jgi:hypothetical protein